MYILVLYWEDTLWAPCDYAGPCRKLMEQKRERAERASKDEEKEGSVEENEGRGKGEHVTGLLL